MIKTVISLFQNKDIRRKILFTLAMLLVYRIGAGITVPGIDTSKLISGLGTDSIVSMMNILGGGSWSQFSVFAMGVGPYITSSIVIELLAMDIIPPLAEMAKNGQKGRQEMDKITRYLAVVLGYVQAYVLTTTFDNSYNILVDDAGIATRLYIATILTAGSFLLVWIGDRIAAYGIGNGISMIIFAGIVSGLPSQFSNTYSSLITSELSGAELWKGIGLFALIVLAYILIIILVVITSNATRKIPIQYTSNSNRKGGKDVNYLPLKINSASVMPVIFSSTIMMAPATIYNMIYNIAKFEETEFLTKLSEAFEWLSDFSKGGALILYLVLVFAFTFFYTNIEVDPEKISDNLNKGGTYIPGVRPGKDTTDYISKVLNRITLLGALFLVFIAALPYVLTIVFTSMPQTIQLGGTSIIIVVGVAQETVKDLENQLTQKEYKGFMKGNK